MFYIYIYRNRTIELRRRFKRKKSIKKKKKKDEEGRLPYTISVFLHPVISPSYTIDINSLRYYKEPQKHIAKCLLLRKTREEKKRES